MASATTILQRSRVPLELRSLVFVAVFVIVAFAVIYPFILLVVNSFAINNPPAPTRYGLDSWRYALTNPGMVSALVNSLYVTAVRQAVSFPAAVLIAWLIARTDMPGGKWLEFMFWIAFFLPVVPVTQAWILLGHPTAGLLNATLEQLPFVEQGPFNVFSFWGIIWVHLVTNSISIKVMLLTPAFRNMDASLEDASRISGANSIKTLWRVTVPVLMPSMATVIMVSLLRAVHSVEIELVLGLPFRFFVFGSKIFDLIRNDPPQFGAATAMGVIVLIAVIPLILFHRWVTTRRQFTTLTGKYAPHTLHLRHWKWPMFGVVLTLAILMTVVPSIFLLMGSFMKFSGFFYDVPGGPWTTNHWKVIVQDSTFLRAFRNTIYMALGAATFSTILFTLVAYMIVRMRSRLRGMLDFLTWLPYVMPGIVLVLAWLWILVQTPFLRPIYGTMFALILVSGLTGMTIGVQIIKSNLLQLGNELEEASFITGGGWPTTLVKVVVPLLAPAMVVIWVLNFVSAAGTAVLPAFLATSKTKPLALLQLENVIDGRYEAAAIVGMIVVVLTIGVAVIARSFGFRLGVGRG